MTVKILHREVPNGVNFYCCRDGGIGPTRTVWWRGEIRRLRCAAVATPPAGILPCHGTPFWDTHHPTEFGHVFFAVTLENVMAEQDK